MEGCPQRRTAEHCTEQLDDTVGPSDLSAPSCVTRTGIIALRNRTGNCLSNHPGVSNQAVANVPDPADLNKPALLRLQPPRLMATAIPSQ